MMIKRSSTAVLLLLFGAVSVEITADELLYDSGVNSISVVALSDQDNSAIGIQVVRADDFTVLLPSRISKVVWRGVYLHDQTPPSQDDFEISFFADDGSGSLPVRNPFAVFDVGNDVERTDTGSNWGGTADIFQYSASIPDLEFAAGTNYWMSISNATFNENDDWWWGADLLGDSALQQDGGDWEGIDLRLDYQLFGQAVPEPSSTIAIGIGIVAGLLRRRR